MRTANNISGLPMFVLSFVFAFGIYQVQKIFSPGSSSYVTVKGLAEKEVEADYGIWTINIELFGNSTKEVSLQKDNTLKEVKQFFYDQGLADEDFSLSGLNINPTYDIKDRYAFRGNMSFRVISVKVHLIEKAHRELATLSDKNVNINMNNWNKQYYFVNIPSIKADLVKDAVRSAQEAAETFATLNQMKLGLVKKADQGVVKVLAYDRTESNDGIQKIVRMVSTVDYFLEKP